MVLERTAFVQFHDKTMLIMRSRTVLVLVCFGLFSSALGIIDCPESPSDPINGQWPDNCVNGTISDPTTCAALCQKPG